MAPRKRKGTTSADQAAADESTAQDQKDIHIQASATVHHAEGTAHVTGAVVNAPDAQSVHVGDTVAGDQHNVTTGGGDYAGDDIDKRQGTFVEIHQYQPPTPIDPAAAAQQLAALPLETIPDLADLPPLSRMPLSRNPLFVGREADLMRLAATLKSGGTAAIGQIAAATGLGGIGKTNLASEFVHRYGQYFAGGVFWLSFADAAAVPAEIAACGVGLDLPGFADLKLDDQVVLVRQVWQQPFPRLLIFDNCEDEALLDQWRPTSGDCRVLVTSRRARWSSVLNVQTLALGVLSRPESIMLLRKHRPDVAEDDPDLDLIAAELGDLPLALHLAGSYLETYRDDPDLGSPAVFLFELRNARLLEHVALQGEDVTPSPTNHVLHVGRTFALSYERLHPDDPMDVLAIALLARAVCFAPGEPIPREMLLATIAVPDTAAQRRANKAFGRLVALGLLETKADNTLTLHRLLAVFVDLVVQDADAQVAVEQALINRAYTLNTVGDPRPLLALEVHLRYLTDRACVREDEWAATLCTNLGYYLRLRGDLIGARPLYEQALTIRQQVQGEEHLDTANILNNLGLLLRDLSDLEGARPLYEQALAIRRKVLGDEYPDTVGSLNNLGRLLTDAGDLEGARPYLEQALAISKKVQGEEHPDTALSLNNLGVLLMAMGDLSAARECLERALTIRRKILGEEHPDTTRSLCNLGILLKHMGDLSGAREYVEQALAIFKKVLGEEHPDTATSLINLGILFQHMGDLSAARAYYEQALAIRRKVLGEERLLTAACLYNLGMLLQDEGDLRGARPYLEQALAIYKKVQWEEHPFTATSLNNLGALLWDVGDLSAARAYYEQALAIYKKVLGEEHPDTAQSLNNLGMLLQDMGDLSGARAYYEQALAVYRKVLGEEHPLTATSLNNLGSLLYDQGSLSGARSLYEQALVIRRKVLGNEYPDTAQSLNNLGSLLKSQGDLSGARPLYEQALAIRQKVLGEEHPDTAFSLNNLGSLLKDVGDLSGARPLYEQALVIYERVLGPDHPNTQVVRRNLAGLDAPAQTPAQQADAAG